MRCLCWHTRMPLCQTRTVLRVLQHHQAAPNPAARNRWMTWMDSSMNERMVPTYLHVPFCCFVMPCLIPFSPFSVLTRFPPLSPFGFQCYKCLFCVVVIQFSHFSCSHIFPRFPFWFSMSFFFWPLFLLTHFPRFTLLVFKVFFFYCCVSACPRWFPNDERIFNCIKASISPLFLGFQCLFFFATFPTHTFSPFSHFGVQSLFYFCTAMFLIVQGVSPMIFQLRPPFLFFHLGGRGRFDSSIVSPKFLWALDPQTHLQ